jgi:hypothetical protein
MIKTFSTNRADDVHEMRRLGVSDEFLLATPPGAIIRYVSAEVALFAMVWREYPRRKHQSP